MVKHVMYVKIDSLFHSMFDILFRLVSSNRAAHVVIWITWTLEKECFLGGATRACGAAMDRDAQVSNQYPCSTFDWQNGIICIARGYGS